MTSSLVLSICLALNLLCITIAFDPTPLQDFCVADPNGAASCKNPANVTANDFAFSGLHLVGNTSNPYRTGITRAKIPGLNGQGLALTRLDILANGFIPPHYHPRATELLVVLEGSIEVGFVTSLPNYRNIGKVLQKGDLFVVPVGLVHYQRAVGPTNAVVLAATNSQNPGIVEVAAGTFGAKPPISSDYLSAAYQLDKKTVELLQTKF